MAPDEVRPQPDDIEEQSPDSYEYVEEVVEYRDTRGLRTILSAVLVILLLLLVGVGYVLWNSSQLVGGPGTAGKRGSNQMVWVRSIYGWGTTQDSQLISPNAVAFGPDGTIWSNSNNRMAVAFTPAGKLDHLITSSPSTQTSTPSSATPSGMTTPTARSASKGVQAVFAIDVDSKNELFVGDDASANVLKFTPDGGLIKGWAIPGLSKMAANDTLVAVTGKGSLGVFNQSTGAPVFGFGTRGPGVNQFDIPEGVHIDDQGFVYVADTQNRRVRKYNPQGRLLWDAGTVPDRKFEAHVQAPTGIFQLPTGVTTDANGRVIVIDAFNYNITVLDGSTGKKVAAYGSYGQADGQFDNPSAIAYDRNRDYFVVADTGNNRLQVVRIPGSGRGITAGSALALAFENPIWILCLPFILLLLAILVAAMMRRRRKSGEAAPTPAE